MASGVSVGNEASSNTTPPMHSTASTQSRASGSFALHDIAFLMLSSCCLYLLKRGVQYKKAVLLLGVGLYAWSVSLKWKNRESCKQMPVTRRNAARMNGGRYLQWQRRRRWATACCRAGSQRRRSRLLRCRRGGRGAGGRGRRSRRKGCRARGGGRGCEGEVRNDEGRRRRRLQRRQQQQQ